MIDTRRHVRRFVAALAVAAAAVAALTFSRDPDGLTAGVVVGFAALGFITSQFPLPVAAGSRFDISFLITFAAMVAGGPATAVIVSVVGTTSVRDAARRGWVRHAFNAGQLTLTAGLAGLTYRGLGGPIGATWLRDPVGEHVPRSLLALAAAAAVYLIINAVLVSTVISLSEQRSFAATLKAHPAVGGNQVAFALLGLLLAILQVRIGWASVVFLVIPLLVARQAFQASLQMQSAYDDIVRALISAIEAKDPYTRGHAERVSRLSEMAARAYGLTEAEALRVRYAAMMHDVGKLSVHATVLRKPGKLTAEEYEHMKVHPVRGVEIVGEIDLMDEALGGIRHHHERMDGGGYPDGLVGEQIPLIARLIMAADAFDSMTSTRSYRRAKNIEDALAELRRCSGTQFDPRAVEALARAVEEHGWEAHPEDAEEADEEAMDDGRAVSL